MSEINEWPLVDTNDDGIRPNGNPDECFYCNQKVGQEHLQDCVIVQRKILINFTITLEIDVPYHWDQDLINQRFNKSSWCADNLIEMLEKQSEKVGCLCGCTKAEFIEFVDDKPIREIRVSDKGD